jgi:hypothetical protein
LAHVLRALDPFSSEEQCYALYTELFVYCDGWHLPQADIRAVRTLSDQIVVIVDCPDEEGGPRWLAEMQDYFGEPWRIEPLQSQLN